MVSFPAKQHGTAWPSDLCLEELDGAPAAGEAGSLAGDLGPGAIQGRPGEFEGEDDRS